MSNKKIILNLLTGDEKYKVSNSEENEMIGCTHKDKYRSKRNDLLLTEERMSTHIKNERAHQNPGNDSIVNTMIEDSSNFRSSLRSRKCFC